MKKICVVFIFLLSLFVFACESTVEITLSGDKEVFVGDQLTINAVVSDKELKVEWSSEDQSIATVKDGVVTAVKAGKVIITVTAGDVKQTFEVEVKEKPRKNPESIVITGAKSIYVDEELTLSLTVLPSDAEYTASWNSSSEAVATVTNGVVKGLSAGKTTITVEADGVSSNCEIEVLEKKLPTALNITGSDNLYVGEEQTLVVVFTPADTFDKSVVWASDNESVAVVSADGKVTAVSKGTANITCTANADTKVSYSFALTVNKYEITVSEQLEVNLGKATNLNATIDAEVNLKYLSSDETVATVDENGNVTGVALGTAVITVSSVDDFEKAEVSVTVIDKVLSSFTAAELKVELPKLLDSYVKSLTGSVSVSLNNNGKLLTSVLKYNFKSESEITALEWKQLSDEVESHIYIKSGYSYMLIDSGLAKQELTAIEQVSFISQYGPAKYLESATPFYTEEAFFDSLVFVKEENGVSQYELNMSTYTGSKVNIVGKDKIELVVTIVEEAITSVTFNVTEGSAVKVLTVNFEGLEKPEITYPDNFADYPLA